MLNWMITIFLAVILSAFFGLGGLTGEFADIAQFLVVLFVLLLVASLICGVASCGRRRT